MPSTCCCFVISLCSEGAFSALIDSKGGFTVARSKVYSVPYDDGTFYVPLIFDDTTGVYRKDTVFVPLSRVAAG